MSTLPRRSTDATTGQSDTSSLRLSDREREQAVAVFNDAVVDGRLSWPEHAERVEIAWSARTQADLAPYLADLGQPTAYGPPQRVAATLSKIIRKPEAGRAITVRSRFGAVYLDLRGLAPGAQLQVEASSFGGKVVLWVGTEATVIDEGEAIIGKRKVLANAPSPSDGPLIRVTGRSVLGHLKVLAGPHHVA